ncbi:hypothetical protein ASD28_13585 [Massilia sp. Root133]|uniref:hypothetical protein n=1 Tax=Massilia sp. Root133 TaxID=1736455 RepID=UPI0006FF1C07|nr:hypothetical protein [Massilia sp. Root133]KQY00338.1 hypothetical protein ASD28_13585 [Massilia sp. Root133]
MPIIAHNAAELAIRPFADRFVEVVQSSFKDWLEGPYASQMQTKAFRAQVVSNQMRANAKRIFDGMDGIRVESVPHYTGLLVGRDLFIRMKKADKKLLSRNYPTQNALASVDQDRDLLGGLARLELVYQLNDVGTAIERIVLLQRQKQSVVWMIDLFGASPMAQNVLPFAPEPAGEGTSVAKRIMKPKRKSDSEKKDVSTG